MNEPNLGMLRLRRPRHRNGKVRVRKCDIEERPQLKFVVNYRELGRRRRRFFTSKAEAETFARQVNTEIANKGREGAEFPTWLRVMAEECNARLEQFGKTLEDATNDYVKRLEGAQKSCSAAELVEEIRRRKEKDGASKRHLEDLRNRLNVFAEHFDGRQVADIETRDITEWLDSLNVKAITRNNYLRLVVTALNYAKDHGYVSQNVASKIQKAKERSQPPGILTPEQTARLLETAEGDMLAYCAIGAFAGLRRAEIERLDWSEIDFENGLIRVEADKAKTGQKRFVQMLPNLRDWLLPIRQLSGLVIGDQFSRRFVATRKAAGIHDWPDNALRHSFASYHLAHFQNAASTALELGHHDSRITFAHYRELVRPKDAGRYWNIRPAKTAEKVVPMLVS
jgi:integrase